MTTCDFISCSLRNDADTTDCPQASITKASSQTFTVTRLTTNIQTS